MSHAISESQGLPARVLLVLGSVRPGRTALPVTLWVNDLLVDSGRFSIDFVDLLELDLPFMDEPTACGPGEYQHEHTQAWSERVMKADAVILVAPAFGEGFSPVVRNALDFLTEEWREKPVGLVSYGRAAPSQWSRLRRSLRSRGMAAVRTPVAIGDVTARVSGVEFDAPEQATAACERMIDDLHARCEGARSAPVASLVEQPV
ncbi:NADPH-dependent FMN reductase [Paramicrobacterium sp. CJ85]|uniref:NADPH-dependent FMN reductase n=1 Tax=Paramicrobacterium sp. CJ85 TaxID=3445355 RepID=UPI003F6463B5